MNLGPLRWTKARNHVWEAVYPDRSLWLFIIEQRRRRQFSLWIRPPYSPAAWAVQDRLMRDFPDKSIFLSSLSGPVEDESVWILRSLEEAKQAAQAYLNVAVPQTVKYINKRGTEVDGNFMKKYRESMSPADQVALDQMLEALGNPSPQLPTLGMRSLGECTPTRRDVMGGWHGRYAPLPQGAKEVWHPQSVLAERKFENWFRTRLARLGFSFGRRLGVGGWGVVYSLKGTDYVVKVTADGSEAATAQRLVKSRVESPALPQILGVWSVPFGDLWFIIREDLPLEIQNAYPALAASFDRLFDAFEENDRRTWYQEAKRDLPPFEGAMLKRFFRELKRIQQQSGVRFYDLTSQNIRVRDRGRPELVISDFGFSAGPSTEVPIAKNPKSRRNPNRGGFAQSRYMLRDLCDENFSLSFDASSDAEAMVAARRLVSNRTGNYCVTRIEER